MTTSIYVGGSFDLFHHGHVNLLRQAKEIASTVIVAVNSDAFHYAYKKSLPVMNHDERLRVVEACKYVDRAFIMGCVADQRTTIESIRPTYILHDDSWMGESLMEQMGLDQKFLDALGITLRYVPRTPGISSGMIRERLRL